MIEQARARIEEFEKLKKEQKDAIAALNEKIAEIKEQVQQLKAMSEKLQRVADKIAELVDKFEQFMAADGQTGLMETEGQMGPNERTSGE